MERKGVNIMEELVRQVEKWASDRGIDKGSSEKQFLKVAEEFGEIAAALARNDQEELKDSIGDTAVTLIILAKQNNLSLIECLDSAYNTIKNRQGKIIDGIFIKDEEQSK